MICPLKRGSCALLLAQLLYVVPRHRQRHEVLYDLSRFRGRLLASLIKKIIGGKPYYYARESKRVDGKPKIVWQKYLGRAEDIIARCSAEPATPKPVQAVVREFGAVMALYDLAQRLKLVEHIDSHVHNRGSGPSVGP
jgi:hypothetical protein